VGTGFAVFLVPPPQCRSSFLNRNTKDEIYAGNYTPCSATKPPNIKHIYCFRYLTFLFRIQTVLTVPLSLVETYVKSVAGCRIFRDAEQRTTEEFETLRSDAVVKTPASCTEDTGFESRPRILPKHAMHIWGQYL